MLNIKTDRNTVTHLKQAKRLIEDPKHWTVGVYAHKFGDVNSLDATEFPSADCFCSVGAIGAVEVMDIGFVDVELLEDFLEYRYLLKAAQQIDPDVVSVEEFNDTHPHEDVMRMFDIAIKMAQNMEPV